MQPSWSVHWPSPLDAPQAPPSLHRYNSSFPLCLFYSRSIYGTTIHSDAQVRNWESSFLDSLFSRFPHIWFVTVNSILSSQYLSTTPASFHSYYHRSVPHGLLPKSASLLQVLPSLIQPVASLLKYKYNRSYGSFKNPLWFPAFFHEVKDTNL